MNRKRSGSDGSSDVCKPSDSQATSTSKRTRRMDDNDVEHDLVEQRYKLINNLLSGLNNERNQRHEARAEPAPQRQQHQQHPNREGPKLVDAV